ncbi:hypothetical protein B0H14DRAFT_2706990 [Mycena olivaceomarginata]|nr:hypothetical protein B0H14DRAFT_2706990 [Mycena olivaceomarginata]
MKHLKGLEVEKSKSRKSRKRIREHSKRWEKDLKKTLKKGLGYELQKICRKRKEERKGKGEMHINHPPTAIAPQISAPATDSSWDIVDQAGFPTSSQMDILLEFVQSFEQHNYPDINLEEGNKATTTAVFASEEPPRQRQKRTCHKCRQDNYKGSNRRELSKNPCADCNRGSCEGRSSAQKNVKYGLSWSETGDE